jgi:hypothetical protein
VPAVQVLADAIRAMVEPARAGVAYRKGGTGGADGKPISLLGLLRDALRAEEKLFEKDPAREKQWRAARSRIVDEFLTVNGRGEGATFRDRGIPQIVPVLVDLARSQRLARCNGEATCSGLGTQLAADLENSLKTPLFGAGLDLVDVILRDEPARRELGRMTSYMMRQKAPWGGSSPSSTPFTTGRGPGALDQSIAAAVDALGALGDMQSIRPLYPMMAQALDHLDPQLSLLSRINARAFDGAGNEICSRELDPNDTIPSTLARLSLPVTPKDRPRQTALQIFLDTIADVNRVDAADPGPLAPDDYSNVFKNVHELLTDPAGGLEQLYASVRNATER